MNRYLRLIIFAVTGGAIGYAYYYFIGCQSGGSCPLTSRWYITTLYGMLTGALMAFPIKRKEKNSLLKENEIKQN